MIRNIIFNNLMCNLGQPKIGVRYGGDYILNYMKINNPINTINFSSHLDYGKTYNLIYDNIKENKFNFNLGGDHSVSVSTIQPLLDIYNKDILIIWIDAHADLNTFQTSKSKNTHGMPLAPLLGLMPHWYNSEKYKFRNRLVSSNLYYYGVRSIDKEEKYNIQKYNLKIFQNKDFLINNIINHPAKKIHISCDVDAIDPNLIYSTGTRVDKGLNVNDVLSVIDVCKKRLVSFDLVEFNPRIGNLKHRDISLATISSIINSVIY